MTHAEFVTLPKDEHDTFISKLLQAIHRNETCFTYAYFIVSAAEEKGMFSNTKFANEVSVGSDVAIKNKEL